MNEPPVDDLLMGAMLQLHALSVPRQHARRTGTPMPAADHALLEGIERVMEQLAKARVRVARAMAREGRPPPPPREGNLIPFPTKEPSA